ncbi:transcriptional regulator [Paucilactobacillus hokkaidonensis JCM 18461]|uniref:Transcriptional regulator n=1 Tax=Paucilactobacillus hokkaidonensis JCM 18461 TaxID=1291742 RepID=A0A0A1GVJ5_9LACO|nr:MarR family transcriptional regulator [Paucilactobacillus hokkaidonensis]BAP86267.1 transcriptional regulator [Paucilactobacillus hokkaidonensis JCM 18461]
MDNVNMWLAVAAKYAGISIDRKLKPEGLGASLYYFILKIHDHDGISQLELGEYIYLDQSGIARGIQQLVELGYVDKIRNQKDKRTSNLYLTQAGKDIYSQIYDKVNQQNELLIKNVPVEQREQFEQNLQIVGQTIFNELQPGKSGK